MIKTISIHSIRVFRVLLGIIGLVLLLDTLVLFALLKINFGTVVPFLLGVIFLVHALFWQAIQKKLTKSVWLQYAWRLLWAMFAVWLLSFAVFVHSLWQQIHTQTPDVPIAAIIVLGAGVNGDQPTPALASRLDAAAKLYKVHPSAVLITSGGVGFARSNSEAAVMANYLHTQHQVALNKVMQEAKSSSTHENLSYSQVLLKQQQISLNQHIAIVTNDFHTIRAKAIANKQGYTNVIMVPSLTPLSIRFNAWFREYFAFISGWLLGEY